MGGGGKKGPSGPSRAEQRAQAGSYWDSYNKWVRDAGERFESGSADARASYAASGGDIGSDGFLKLEQGRRDQYEQELSDLKGGEHYRYLNDFYQQHGTTNSSRDVARTVGGSSGSDPVFDSMEAFYTSDAFRNAGASDPIFDDPNAPKDTGSQTPGQGEGDRQKAAAAGVTENDNKLNNPDWWG